MQRLRLLTGLSVCAVLGAAASTASAASITNGDFETYAPFYASPGSPITSGGWTFEEYAGVVGTVGNPGNAVRLESNGLATTDPRILQTVSTLVIGQAYRVTWDLALRVAIGSGNGRSFGVFLDTQTYGTALVLDEHLSTMYESQFVDFVATSTSHTLIFAGELDSRTNGLPGRTDISYNIDNIAIATTPIPEPSSATLLGLGLAAFGAGRRRRRA